MQKRRDRRIIEGTWVRINLHRKRNRAYSKTQSQSGKVDKFIKKNFKQLLSACEKNNGWLKVEKLLGEREVICATAEGNSQCFCMGDILNWTNKKRRTEIKKMKIELSNEYFIITSFSKSAVRANIYNCDSTFDTSKWTKFKSSKKLLEMVKSQIDNPRTQDYTAIEQDGELILCTQEEAKNNKKKEVSLVLSGPKKNVW